jgi:KUP system potassium uptake protein
MVILATAATVIAAQAVISGAFSVTRQAVQLGFLPLLTIRHTSKREAGQIYVPVVNWGLFVAIVALVIGFGSSSALASAYGIAVTGTLAIDTILFFVVVRFLWHKPVWMAVAGGAAFLVVDLTFFAANLTKVASGGWVPLAIGSVVFSVMTTWRRGRALLGQAFLAQTLPLEMFMGDLAVSKPQRVRGTAVFMTSNPKGAPPVLLHHFKHNKVLHEQVILLSIATQHIPEVPDAERIKEINDLGHGFWQVSASYGFMQTPNVLEVLETCRMKGLITNKTDTSFFLGRETLILTNKRSMALWRKMLFSFMSRNARPANAFFQIPPNRVVELGTQIEL